MKDELITLAHGSGGKAMQRLIGETIAQFFPSILPQDDFGIYEASGSENKIIVSTDSFVISPRHFLGGDIGKLAVIGSCNDVAMSGAKPIGLTCSLIIEEGFSLDELKSILKSMANTARECGVEIKTGDTKVVPRGACDGLFINTTALAKSDNAPFFQSSIRVGDKIIVSRDIGCHGACIADLRNELGLSTDVSSDCASLYPLIDSVSHLSAHIRYFRDATRGGLAAVLNELAAGSETQFDVIEEDIPVSNSVRGVCEILGLDPLYLANEGTLVCIVDAETADEIISCFRQHQIAENACIIGEVVDGRSGRVTIESMLGVKRLLDMPEGELLPRIC